MCENIIFIVIEFILLKGDIFSNYSNSHLSENYILLLLLLLVIVIVFLCKILHVAETTFKLQNNGYDSKQDWLNFMFDFVYYH